MATLTLTTLTDYTGNDLSPTSAASGGDEFVNNGNTLLYVKNSSGASRTVTVVTQASVLGSIAVADVAVALDDGDEVLLPPLPPKFFNDANGKVQITYSSEAGLTVAAVKVS